jgi:hypothetical protein
MPGVLDSLDGGLRRLVKSSHLWAGPVARSQAIAASCGVHVALSCKGDGPLQDPSSMEGTVS